jgi:hypothetical protein
MTYNILIKRAMEANLPRQSSSQLLIWQLLSKDKEAQEDTVGVVELGFKSAFFEREIEELTRRG